jgi:predicted RNA-binding protein YlqC (UPF0109 family)
MESEESGRLMSMEGEASLKALIEYLVTNLVDEPEHVQVVEVPGEEAITYEVRVAPNDLGKVIGKQGRIANALRTVAKASAMKNKQKVYVEIVA